MGLKRASHAVYDTVYHLVWCPKFRKKVFVEEDIRGRAEQVIKEICDEYGIEIEEMEVAIDHVHLLVSFPPKYSIGDVVSETNRTISLMTSQLHVRRFQYLDRYL